MAAVFVCHNIYFLIKDSLLSCHNSLPTMDTEDFNFLCGIVLSVIISTGLAGNILSVIIWTKGERCRTYQSAPYLTALALSDSCNLCFSGLVYAIEYLFQFSLYDVNVACCKLLRPAGFFFSLLSTWLIVFVTIERTIAVRKPFRSVRWKGKRMSKHLIAICSLFVGCLLLELPWTIGLNILPVDTNSTCFPDRMYDVISIKMDAANDAKGAGFNKTMTSVLETCQFSSTSFVYKYESIWRFWILDFGLIFSVPLVILTTCNIAALITVRRRNSKCIMGGFNGNQGETTASRAMTARVVAISVVHCISVGPYSISSLIPSYVNAINSREEAIVWLYSFFNFIWYLNHSVNFILYSLFGRAFRRDCKALFCKKRRQTSYKPCIQSVSQMPVAMIETVTVTLSVASSLTRMGVTDL